MGEYLVKVEEARPAAGGKPSAGPVYRSIFAKDGIFEVPPDGPESPWDFLRDSVKRNPTKPMLGCRQIVDGKAGAYGWMTYQQVYNATLKIGSAMRTRGVNPGNTCGILGTNSPEWTIAMEACIAHSVIYVPLYETLGATAVEFIINHAEIPIVFVQESKIPAILSCLPKCVSHLKTIVSFGKVSDKQKNTAEELGVSCFSWEEFAELGNLDENLPQKKKSDIFTIMYTSGTTGEPKGVVITSGAVMTQILSIHALFEWTNDGLTEDDVYISYLTLAHIFEQSMLSYCVYRGSTIGFWQGDIRYLIDDLVELKPTFMCGVPRIYDRLYKALMDKISALGILRKLAFKLAYYYKLRKLENGFKQREATPVMDKLVFDEIKQALGGRLRIMISGAAPLPRHVEEFFWVTCRSLFAQGYGLTECCSGCYTAVDNVYSMMGTVGVPMLPIEARLESVPDMGCDALADVPRGEILIRGNTLFSGYYKRPELTEEVFEDDGWFHTGDIGELVPGGFMKIVDRKKNIFKLSQGEYVAVERVENTYIQSPLVTQIWVYGNSFESFLVAVVVPEREAVESWAADNKVEGDFQSLCSDQRAKKYIFDELNAVGKKHELRGFEMIKAVHLEPSPFDLARDLVTPSMKLKRPRLLKYYKEYIDKMYAEGKGIKN